MSLVLQYIVFAPVHNRAKTPVLHSSCSKNAVSCLLSCWHCFHWFYCALLQLSVHFTCVFVSYLDCGRFTRDCTSLQCLEWCMRLIFIDLGYRQIYTVGVYNGTVSELSETYRYYPSTDCSDSPAMIVTTK